MSDQAYQPIGKFQRDFLTVTMQEMVAGEVDAPGADQTALCRRIVAASAAKHLTLRFPPGWYKFGEVDVESSYFTLEGLGKAEYQTVIVIPNGAKYHFRTTAPAVCARNITLIGDGQYVQGGVGATCDGLLMLGDEAADGDHLLEHVTFQQCRRALYSTVKNVDLRDVKFSNCQSGWEIGDATDNDGRGFRSRGLQVHGTGLCRSFAFTADAGTDVLSASGHVFANRGIVRVSSTGTLPAPLAADTTYYVRDVGTGTLKLAATDDGAAIDVTTTGTGVHTIRSWPDVAVYVAGLAVQQVTLADNSVDAQSGGLFYGMTRASRISGISANWFRETLVTLMGASPSGGTRVTDIQARTFRFAVTLTAAGTTATAATADGRAHNVAPGHSVIIRDATHPEYEGKVRVVSTPSASTFTYEMASAPAGGGTGVMLFPGSLVVIGGQSSNVGVEGITADAVGEDGVRVEGSAEDVQIDGAGIAYAARGVYLTGSANRVLVKHMPNHCGVGIKVDSGVSGVALESLMPAANTVDLDIAKPLQVRGALVDDVGYRTIRNEGTGGIGVVFSRQGIPVDLGSHAGALLATIEFEVEYGAAAVDVEIVGTGDSGSHYLLRQHLHIFNDNNTPTFSFSGAQQAQSLSASWAAGAARRVTLTITNALGEYCRGVMSLTVCCGGSAVSGRRGVTVVI